MVALYVVIDQLKVACESVASYVYVYKEWDMACSSSRQYVFLNRPWMQQR
jgi:hypothetical protein